LQLLGQRKLLLFATIETEAAAVVQLLSLKKLMTFATTEAGKLLFTSEFGRPFTFLLLENKKV
jgi:hypothetical protein